MHCMMNVTGNNYIYQNVTKSKKKNEIKIQQAVLEIFNHKRIKVQ